MRLGLFPYLALIGAICGGQYVAATQLGSDLWIFAALAGLQLAKTPIAAARARDLGYDADEAVLALLPLANVALFWKLLAGTPKDAVRESRMQIHVGESTAWELARFSLKATTTAPWILLLCMVIGAIDATITEAVVASLPTLATMNPATLATATMALGGSALLLLAWTLVQAARAASATRMWLIRGAVALGGGLGFASTNSFVPLVAAAAVLFSAQMAQGREMPSRRSWVPTIFLPVFAFGAVVVGSAASVAGSADATQAHMFMLVFSGFALWPVFAVLGAWAAFATHAAGRTILAGESPSPGAIADGNARFLDDLAVHAGVRYTISLGIQCMVLPGIMYATRYAFIDQVLREEPEVRAYERASALSHGHRMRALRVMLLVGILPALATIGVNLIDLGDFASLTVLLADPFAASSWTMIVGGAAFGLSFAWFELAMVKMYAERVAVTSSRATAPVADEPAPPSEA